MPQTLRQYALLADGERGALIGPRGDIGFLCAPRWHDDAVFSGLLGGRGAYAVTLRDERFTWGGHYEQGSLVWRSRWVTRDAVVECREALAFPGERDRVVLLRRVEPDHAERRSYFVEQVDRLRRLHEPDFGSVHIDATKPKRLTVVQ